MIIYSELSAEELEEFFADDIVVELPVGVETMDYLDYAGEVGPHEHNVFAKLCATLEEPISSEGYFVISQYYSPFTQQDLRGH